MFCVMLAGLSDSLVVQHLRSSLSPSPSSVVSPAPVASAQRSERFSSPTSTTKERINLAP